MTHHRSLIAVMIHAVLIQAVTFVLRPASTYRAIELDSPAWALGAIGASFAVAPLALALPAGVITDRLGERRMMLIGSVVSTAAGATFWLGADDTVGLVAANALLGTGHLACMLGQQAAVANSSGNARGLDSRFGYYTFAASIGQAIGPALIAVAGGTSVRPDTGAVFATATILSAFLLPAAWLTRASFTPSTRSAPAGRTSELLRLPGLKAALVTSAVILSAVDLMIVYLPALGTERGYSAALVSALLTVRALFSMASRAFLGRLTTVFGRSRVMRASIVTSAVALASCAVPMPAPALFVAVALAGLGLGVGQPLTMSWLSERAPEGMRARALSLRLVGNRAGQVGVPAALGLIAASAGAAGALLASAAALGLTFLLSRGVDLG
jgi:MFS family permease